MQFDEIKAMLDGKTVFDFRAERAFDRIDADNSGLLEKEEIKAFIRESVEGKVDEIILEEDI